MHGVGALRGREVAVKSRDSTRKPWAAGYNPRPEVDDVVWLLLGLLLATPAAAQQRGADTRTWYQAYQEGRQQVQRGQWQAAIASLEVAKRNGPKPGRRIPFYGDVFDDFLPDYFLGIAYLNAGRAQDAVTAFNTVRDAKLIAQRDREYVEFTKQSTAANERVRTENQVAQAAPQQAPPTAQQQQQAQQQTPAQVPAPPVTQSAANNPPDTPAGVPVALPPPATQSPVQAPTVRPTPTPSPVVPRPTPQTRPPAAQKAPASGLPPEVEGLTAFFSGDYQQAANLLSALAVNGASPRVEFYLACSRAALVLTLNADPATLTEARARFSAVNTNLFTNDRRYVSPRILDLLRTTRTQ